MKILRKYRCVLLLGSISFHKLTSKPRKMRSILANKTRQESQIEFIRFAEPLCIVLRYTTNPFPEQRLTRFEHQEDILLICCDIHSFFDD